MVRFIEYFVENQTKPQPTMKNLISYSHLNLYSLPVKQIKKKYE